MTLKTKTWKRHEKAKKEAEKDAKAIHHRYAKILQQRKKYKSDKNYNQAIIEAINRDRNYTYKTIKKTKKKILVKRKKPRELNKSELDKFNRAKSNLEIAKSNLAKLKKSSNYRHAKSKYSKAKKIVAKQKKYLNDYIKKQHKNNYKKIQKNRRQNLKKFMAPHSSLYQTDNGSSTQVFLFAKQEDESNDSDSTAYPIDNDDPMTDHVRRSDKTITIDGFLYGPDFASKMWGNSSGLSSVNQQYSHLLKWNRHGIELSYKSDESANVKHMNHMYFKHVYITNLTKNLDTPYKDMMEVNITLTYLYRAQVSTSKNSKGRKTKQGHYLGSKKIKLKKSMSAAQLAKKYHTSAKNIEKMNNGKSKFARGRQVKVEQGIKAVNKKVSSNKVGRNSINKKVNKILHKHKKG